MDAFFSPKRLTPTLRNDIITLYRPFILSNIIVLSISMMITVFVFRTGTGWNYYDFLFSPLLFIGGYLFSAGMFGDVHNRLKGSSYLLVPASVTEKFASRLIIAGLLYVIGIIAIMSIFSYLVFFVVRGASGTYLPVFSPFRTEIMKLGGIYFVTQSIFLFGSTLFKRHAFLKTLLIMIAVSIAFSIIQGIIGALVIRGSRSFQINITIDELVQFFDSLAPAIKVFFWFIMAPAFWIASIWRLRNLQR